MTKKTKIAAIFLTVMFMALIMSVNVSAAAAQFLDFERKTRGNWVGKYGNEGYIVISADQSLQKIPSYAKIDYAGHNFWEWQSFDREYTGSEDDLSYQEEGALFRNPEMKGRIAACYYQGDSFYVNVDVGSETKMVSMYMLDYDYNGREAAVTVYDDGGKKLVGPVELDYYDEGCYLSFNISGSVEFMFENTGGVNVVLSGIFFDPVDPSIVPNASLKEVAPTVESNKQPPLAQEKAEPEEEEETEEELNAVDESGGNSAVVIIIAVLAVLAVAVAIVLVLGRRTK